VAPVFADALPYLVPALAPALAVLVAPLSGKRVRTGIAIGFLLIAVGFGVDLLVADHSAIVTLEVVNVFFSAETGTQREWVVATQTAPLSAWHVVVIAWCTLHGSWLLLRRARPKAAPDPIVHGVGLFWIYLAVRLALEKAAASRGLVWAVGTAPTLVLMLPFIGWYAGRRGASLFGLLRTLLAMAVLQRLPLIVFAYFATTRGLGTHLDTHRITEMRGLFGPVRFDGDPVRTWLWTVLVPQTAVWVPITLLVGMVVGGATWARARRRARPPSLAASRFGPTSPRRAGRWP